VDDRAAPTRTRERDRTASTAEDGMSLKLQALIGFAVWITIVAWFMVTL
jgi:hypothetical protein